MNSFKIGGTNYEFKVSGSAGYFEGRQAFNHNAAPGPITITSSRSALLRLAGLSRKSANHARLSVTFAQLREPVGVGQRDLPPLLVTGHRKLASGSVRLDVNKAWLPARGFGRVPLPLPTHGANTLALFLFLCGTDQRANSTNIDAEKLCGLLGVSFACPADANRALDDALALVNRHLKELNKQGSLTEEKLPVAFDIRPVGDGTRVRCQAIYDPPTKGGKIPDKSRGTTPGEVWRSAAKATAAQAAQSACEPETGGDEIEPIDPFEQQDREYERRAQQREQESRKWARRNKKAEAVAMIVHSYIKVVSGAKCVQEQVEAVVLKVRPYVGVLGGKVRPYVGRKIAVVVAAQAEVAFWRFLLDLLTY